MESLTQWMKIRALVLFGNVRRLSAATCFLSERPMMQLCFLYLMYQNSICCRIICLLALFLEVLVTFLFQPSHLNKKKSLSQNDRFRKARDLLNNICEILSEANEIDEFEHELDVFKGILDTFKDRKRVFGLLMILNISLLIHNLQILLSHFSVIPPPQLPVSSVPSVSQFQSAESDPFVSAAQNPVSSDFSVSEVQSVDSVSPLVSVSQNPVISDFSVSEVQSGSSIPFVAASGSQQHVISMSLPLDSADPPCSSLAPYNFSDSDTDETFFLPVKMKKGKGGSKGTKKVSAYEKKEDKFSRN